MKLLTRAWNKWLKIGHVIGNFQAQIILTAFYYLILFPLGFGYSVLSDPMRKNLKNRNKTNFQNWMYPDDGDIKKARKQF